MKVKINGSFAQIIAVIGLVTFVGILYNSNRVRCENLEKIDAQVTADYYKLNTRVELLSQEINYKLELLVLIWKNENPSAYSRAERILNIKDSSGAIDTTLIKRGKKE